MSEISIYKDSKSDTSTMGFGYDENTDQGSAHSSSFNSPSTDEAVQQSPTSTTADKQVNENTEGEEDYDGEDSASQSGVKRKLKKEQRKCTVCGDKALGYNFDAITCESCKAFFRRNANRAMIPKCMFQGNCAINANTRRFCSSCRLKKCFAVGMKKDMILGEDERLKRIAKVKQNRAKKLEQLQKNVNADLSRSNSNGMDTTERSTGDLNLCVKMEAEIDETSRRLFSQGTGVYNALQDSHPPAVDASPSSRLLSNEETELVEFISTTYSSTFGSTAEESPLTPEATTLEVFINHLGCLVKLLIRFAKKLSDFVVLPQNAQVNILKNSLLDCICWRSAHLLNLERGNWINHEGREVSLEVLTAAFGDVDPTMREEYFSLFGRIKRSIGSDTTFLSLVQCVVLFTPEYSCEGVRAIVSSTQDKFMVLLKHYLESRYDWATAFQLYSNMITYMCQVKEYTSKHSKFLQKCDPTQVEPLLLEVFNISMSK